MYRQLCIIVMMLAFTVGCSMGQQTTKTPQGTLKTGHETAHAAAKIIDKTGNQIGTAQFKEATNGVQMQLSVSKLSPGMHGFHIHMVGKCTPPDFMSAKGHFNPTHKQHGKDNPLGKHRGDLLNLTANDQGQAKEDVLIEGVTLKPNLPHSLRHSGGTSLVIHEKPDDYKTDPSGNSGERIACGVIQ